MLNRVRAKYLSEMSSLSNQYGSTFSLYLFPLVQKCGVVCSLGKTENAWEKWVVVAAQCLEQRSAWRWMIFFLRDVHAAGEGNLPFGWNLPMVALPREI